MLIPSARWHFDSTTKLLTIAKKKKKKKQQNKTITNSWLKLLRTKHAINQAQWKHAMNLCLDESETASDRMNKQVIIAIKFPACCLFLAADLAYSFSYHRAVVKQFIIRSITRLASEFIIYLYEQYFVL